MAVTKADTDPEAAARERVIVPTVLEADAAAARIGLILLSTDLVTESAFRAMAPADVVWMTSRVANINPTTNANLRRMVDLLPDAMRLLPEDAVLDVAAYACTSGVVAMGQQAAFDRIRSVRPGLACTAPIIAALAAFQALGIRRIGLLTPYIEEVDLAIAAWLEERDVAVPALASFDLLSDSDMARVPPADIARAAVGLDRPGLDAVFVSCTALRTWPVIEEIEQRLGKPVITSHQALLWHALRLAGYDAPIRGFGRLLKMSGGPNA